MIKLLFAYLVIAVRRNVLPARSGKNKYIYGTVPAAVSNQFHPCAPRISAQGWKRSPLAPPCTPARVKPVSMILQMSVVEGGIPFIWAYPTYQHSIFMNYLPISAVFLWITYLSAQRIYELPTYLRSVFMNCHKDLSMSLWQKTTGSTDPIYSGWNPCNDTICGPDSWKQETRRDVYETKALNPLKYRHFSIQNRAKFAWKSFKKVLHSHILFYILIELV